MTAGAQSAGMGVAQGAIAPGTIIADRFTIEALVGNVEIATVYRASDAQGGIAQVWLLPASSDSVLSAAAARDVDHPNLARILAVGDHDGQAFIAYAHHDGHSLRQVLERRQQTTGHAAFNPKGVLHLLQGVAAGVGAAQPGYPHGCLGLDTVTVTGNGAVVVYGLGLAGAAAEMAGTQVLPAWPSLSPEVMRGSSPTPASDVYSMGALTYYALVGAHPLKGCKRPSEVVASLGAGIDQLVGKAMNPAPGQRHGSPAELVQALAQLVAAAAPAPAAARSQAGRPSLAQAIVSGDVADASPAGAPLQVSAALEAALADTDERFLINMGNLDYGPFSLREVVDKIESDEILPGHLIIDKDTGNRQDVADQPLLADLVEQAKQRRDEARRAQAEVQHASQEKRRGFALYAFIILGVAALGGGAYFTVSALSADDHTNESAEVAALDQGALRVKITPISRSATRSRGHGRRHKGSGGVSGGWDDSLDMDLASGGGSERLDDSQINPVIQRHGGSLGRCLTSTGSRVADIDFIIVGTGRVSQVRVNGQTGGALANCVRGAMMKMKFPSFDGPRTKANFSMSL